MTQIESILAAAAEIEAAHHSKRLEIAKRLGMRLSEHGRDYSAEAFGICGTTIISQSHAVLRWASAARTAVESGDAA